MNPLRNCILIALATDATPEEYEHAHGILDLLQQGDTNGGVDPQYLINQTAPANAATTPAPAAAQQPAAPAGTGTVVELDSAGFPHDARIHSSNGKKGADGTWWAKRGVTPAVKAQVEAELRATVGAAPVTAAPPSPPVTTTAPPSPAAAAGGPPMPGANLPPMPGAAVIDPAYAALTQFLAANTNSTANPGGKLTDKYVSDILTHYGVADGSLQNLAHRLDLVPTIHNWLLSVVNGTAG